MSGKPKQKATIQAFYQRQPAVASAPGGHAKQDVVQRGDQGKENNCISLDGSTSCNILAEPKAGGAAAVTSAPSKPVDSDDVEVLDQDGEARASDQVAGNAAGPSNSSQPMQTPAAGAKSRPGDTSAAATPAPGPTPATCSAQPAPSQRATQPTPAAALTAAQKQELQSQCEEEMPLLEAQLDERPDLTALAATLGASLSHGNSKKSAEADANMVNKHAVALYVEGSSQGLTQLAESTCAAINAARGEGGQQLTALVVRNIISDAAARKSYGLKDGTMSDVDCLEDASAEYHWCWELRDIRNLPKGPLRAAAELHRKHRKQVLDRLKACSAFAALAKQPTSNKAAEGRLAKAAAKLERLPGLTVLKAQLEAGVAGEQDKGAAAAAASAKKEQQAQEHREAKQKKATDNEQDAATAMAAKEAAAAEKERVKAEKEAEKAEKEAEKARHRAEKEAERVRKAEEAQRKKEQDELKAKGFHNKKALDRARNTMMSFIAKAPPLPPIAPRRSRSTSSGPSAEHMASAHDTPAQPQGLLFHFSSSPAVGTKRSREQMEQLEGLDADIEALAQQRQQQQQQQQQGQQQGQQQQGQQERQGGACAVPALVGGEELVGMARDGWRARRHEFKRLKGVPPPWARKPGATTDFATLVQQQYGDGVDLNTIHLWRRRLIKHWDSVRPPYYGSVSRRSTQVTGRRPLGRDPELDYDVMSDQDWEEEPEGESLSDDDNEEKSEAGAAGAACGGEETEGDSFMVDDGYLSEDEGMAAEGEEGARSPGADAMRVDQGNASADPRMQQLDVALERARRTNRPLILCRLPTMQWEPTSALDASVLQCLRGDALRTDIHITPPAAPANSPSPLRNAPGACAADGRASPRPGTPTEGAAAGAGEAAAGGTGKRGRPHASFPEEMLAALVAHVHKSRQAMDKLVAAFAAAHEARHLTKSCIKDKIKEICTWTQGRSIIYIVKPEVLAQVAAAAANAGAGATGASEAAAAAGGAAAGLSCAGGGSGAGDTPMPDAPQLHTGPSTAAASLTVAEARVPASSAAVPAAAETSGRHQPSAAATPAEAAAPTAAAAAAAAAAPAVPSGTEALAPSGSEEPPAKRHKTPLSSKQPVPASNAKPISAFFKPAAKAVAPPQQQQQQQQQQQAPIMDLTDSPSTPKKAKPAAPKSPQPSAQVDSRALPLLTPPSDSQPPRSPLPNSPIPFKGTAEGVALTQAPDAAAAGSSGQEAGGDAGAGAMDVDVDGGAAAGHAGQAAAAAADASAASAAAADTEAAAGARTTATTAAAATGAAPPGKAGTSSQAAPPNRWIAQADCRGMGLQGGDASHMLPQLKGPEGYGWQRSGAGDQAVWVDPELPCRPVGDGKAYWRQLEAWVVHVKEPIEADIEAAFEAFNANVLPDIIHTMPQAVLTAMVKTLGSRQLGPALRASCARCLANTVQVLAVKEGEQLQQQQQERQQQQQQQQQQQVAIRPQQRQKQQRSVPVVACIEELISERGLLQAIRGGFDDGPEAGYGLTRYSSQLLACLLQVGLHSRLGRKEHPVSARTAAAVRGLRCRVAGDKEWRILLKRCFQATKETSVAVHAAMVLTALLDDDEARPKLVVSIRAVPALMQAILKGLEHDHKALNRWMLVAATAFIDDESDREVLLPTMPLKGLGHNAVFGNAVRLSRLATVCLDRDVHYQRRSEVVDLKLALRLAQRLADFISTQHMLCGGHVATPLQRLFTTEDQGRNRANANGSGEESDVEMEQPEVPSLLVVVQGRALTDVDGEVQAAAQEVLRVLGAAGLLDGEEGAVLAGDETEQEEQEEEEQGQQEMEQDQEPEQQEACHAAANNAWLVHALQ